MDNMEELTSLQSKALYLFIDESGDFNFKASGTDHFILTCLAASRPFELADSLDLLKYELLEAGK